MKKTYRKPEQCELRKPQTIINEAVAKLKNFDTKSLTQKNELFMGYPQHDIEVSYFDDKGQGNNIVYLINFAHTERDNFHKVKISPFLFIFHHFTYIRKLLYYSVF